jgi:iron complex transport system ATP-binding protein
METNVILKDLTVGYGGRVLIERANATIAAGALTALVGRNGTGKSSLLRVLAGLAKPLGGAVFFGLHANEGWAGGEPNAPQNLATLTPITLAHTVSLVTTQRIRMPNLRVRDVVALGRSPHTDWLGNLTPDDNAAIDLALSLVDMTPFAAKPLDTLSDGEAQRVMIARAVAQNTPVILLDEPTAFLDFVARREVCSLLRELAVNQYKTILFSSHELSLVDEFATAKLTLDTSGQIFFQ